MGFTDIPAKTTLEGVIARLQVVLMKEELCFPSSAPNHCCSFFTLSEKKEKSNSVSIFFLMCVFQGKGIQVNKLLYCSTTTYQFYLKLTISIKGGLVFLPGIRDIAETEILKKVILKLI